MAVADENARCPECGESCGVDFVLPHDGRPFYRCQRCDWIFLRPGATGLPDYQHYNALRPSREEATRMLPKASGRFHESDSGLLFSAFEAALLLSRAKMAEQEGLRILDVGCGPGALLQALKHRYPTALLAGIDPSESNVAKARGTEGIDIHHGYFPEEIFDEGSFDVIVAFGNLMLHPNPLDSIRRVSALLKPGGLFIFDVKNPSSATRQVLRLLSKTGMPSKIPLMRRIYAQAFHGIGVGMRPANFRTILPECGFRIESLQMRSTRTVQRDRLGRSLTRALFRASDWLDRATGAGAWIQCTARKL